MKLKLGFNFNLQIAIVVLSLVLSIACLIFALSQELEAKNAPVHCPEPTHQIDHATRYDYHV
jgi:hypothetical protein